VILKTVHSSNGRGLEKASVYQCDYLDKLSAVC